ncbi:hypothetical protein ALT1644_500013 [Alteromonas macleodii]
MCKRTIGVTNATKCNPLHFNGQYKKQHFINLKFTNGEVIPGLYYL